ncbi:MAG: hypothetical protein BWY42_00611 [Candidatus Omnitrophica bacterium ADurb.Bin277]|nr:MAG: hypothetical protein BWY42_00611 [Candidatus Omnitrophica bacterium ADurb.Bin277]
MTVMDPLDHGVVNTGSFVYGLVRDMPVAGQLVKCAGRFGLKARIFDRAETLLREVGEAKPFLIILDFDHLENEAYKVLKEARQNADSKDVPLVGFVSQPRAAVKQEAQQSGCDRVYMKTEFNRELPDIVTRYAK